MEAQTIKEGAVTLTVCSACLGATWEHRDDKACDGAEFTPHTFDAEKDYRTERVKAQARQLEKRADVAVSKIRNHNELHDKHGAQSTQHNATLRAMCHTAVLLGGESLQSFVRCVEALANMKAILQYDGAPLSLCWQGSGMFGGFIFHWDAREWGLHT